MVDETDASACTCSMARGSQSTFSRRSSLSHASVRPGLICCRGVRAHLSAPRHVRRAVRDSGCTIGGAVPEISRPTAQISESVVSPPGLAPPFGRLLWAARSAVACPGCLWGGAAWHGACFFHARWWSAPAAPSCRGSRFDSSCRDAGPHRGCWGHARLHAHAQHWNYPGGRE